MAFDVARRMSPEAFRLAASMLLGRDIAGHGREYLSMYSWNVEYPRPWCVTADEVRELDNLWAWADDARVFAASRTAMKLKEMGMEFTASGKKLYVPKHLRTESA